MIQEMSAYLLFAGEAADAIALYQRVLGAEVTELMHWKDRPGDDLPPEIASRVMHSTLAVGPHRLHLADLHETKPTPHEHFALHLEFDEPDAQQAAFDALAEGGTVTMPFEDTFWNARFGKLVDRFGVSWSFNCQLP